RSAVSSGSQTREAKAAQPGAAADPARRAIALGSARRSDRPKPALRKVILDGDRRSDGRYLEVTRKPWECRHDKKTRISSPEGAAEVIGSVELLSPLRGLNMLLFIIN